ncbi:unnamed protein product [Moneuplotes crassus]|uniref:Uncharacterized protein n=2 Tax=Euplotes crassus TaxID=5936 RepID=A0AAD1ULX5_EUPCR|nr:unnamed protein product [Moneuplotes crassus]
MNRNFAIVLVVTACLVGSVVADKTINLVTSGSQQLNIIYKEPQDGELLRVQTQVILDSVLGSAKYASAICANTGSSSYTVSDGTTVEAFGFMFACSISGGCTNSQDVGVTFYGSTAQYSSSNWYWKVNTRVDISSVNKGTEAGNGLTVTSVFGLPSNFADWANIPLQDVTAYLKCFGAFNVDSTSANINSDQTLTSWPTQTEAVTITAADLKSSGMSQFSLLKEGIVISSIALSSFLL